MLAAVPVAAQRLAHRAREGLVARGRDDAVHARPLVDRHELRRALAEHRLRRLAQQVELELDPGDRLDAHGPGALDDRAQHGPRRQRDGAPVVIDEVAQQERGAVVPRDDAGGLEVGDGTHVGVARPREVAGVLGRRLDGLVLVDRQRPDDVAERDAALRGAIQLGDRDALAPHDPVGVGAREDHRLDATLTQQTEALLCQRGQSVDAAMRTLLIDNYDSFTYNLFHLLGEVNGDEPIVVRNDELPWEQLAALPVDNIVISPGPGRPERERDVGVSLDVLERAEVPVLGVCLGHQALAHMTGGAIDHAPEVMHGRLSRINHDGRGLFESVPQGFAAVRYHSLVVGAVPAALRVTAWTPDQVVMGLEHRTRPLWGVQFHPESISTKHGRTLMRNFRDLTRANRRSRAAAPRHARPPEAGVRVRHRALETWRDPEAAFAALYGDREYAVWLDSSRVEPGLARFSFIGAPEGPLGQIVRYGVAEHALTIERASGREELRESVLDYCERELVRLRADAPGLPFDFTCGFAGYLGYELKADCGGELVHRSTLPDAALLFCDRLIAFDHDQRRVHLLALADAKGAAAAEAWLAAAERELEGLPPPA